MTNENQQDGIKLSPSENQKIAGMSEDEALTKLMAQPVQYTNIDQDKLDSRKAGEDFEGTVIEFDRTFQWIFTNPETQVLIEISTTDPFTGKIHIKDKTLDPKTYPNHEQVINFKDGEIVNQA